MKTTLVFTTAMVVIVSLILTPAFAAVNSYPINVIYADGFDQIRQQFNCQSPKTALDFERLNRQIERMQDPWGGMTWIKFPGVYTINAPAGCVAKNPIMPQPVVQSINAEALFGYMFLLLALVGLLLVARNRRLRRQVAQQQLALQVQVQTQPMVITTTALDRQQREQLRDDGDVDMLPDQAVAFAMLGGAVLLQGPARFREGRILAQLQPPQEQAADVQQPALVAAPVAAPRLAAPPAPAAPKTGNGAA